MSLTLSNFNQSYKPFYKYSINDTPIITELEQKEIVDWLNSNYLRLKKNGDNRYMKSMYDIPDLPKIVWDIRKRIVELENLHEAISEPVLKDAIGYTMDSGQLHQHTDPNKDDLFHTRFNVYVQLPEKGGFPVYGGNVYRLRERTYICCRSGIDSHYCEKVEGSKARIVLSYGFLLEKERVENIVYDYD